jgi:hypothetical protein
MPSVTSIDVKLRGMFTAEVVCDWRGEFHVIGVTRAVRVYLLDVGDDIVRLLNSPTEDRVFTCTVGEEFTIESFDAIRGVGPRLME